MTLFTKIQNTALLAVFAAATLGGCAHQKASDGTALGGRADASKAIPADPAGRMHGYVESRQITDFCPGRASEAVRCAVTYGWDYDRGVAVRRMYDPDGKLIESQDIGPATVALTEIETARVEALVRADPRVAPIINRPGVKIWRGGFIYIRPGDAHCGERSRCVRAIAGEHDGEDAVSHSIVDLMTDRVVYPFYQPTGAELADHPKGKQ
jgi:hypothetical protein